MFVGGDTVVPSYAFANCTNLEVACFPKASSIGSNTSGCSFKSCSNLKTVYIGNGSSNVSNKTMRQSTFENCSSLQEVILRRDVVYSLASTSAIASANRNALIYVPYTLLSDYKSATNWSTYADRIMPLYEYGTEAGVTLAELQADSSVPDGAMLMDEDMDESNPTWIIKGET